MRHKRRTREKGQSDMAPKNRKKKAHGITCYCEGSCPDNRQNGTCEVRLGGKCFSAVEEFYDQTTGLIEPEFSFGCLSPDQQVLLQCNAGKSSHIHGKNIACCSDVDLCNKELFPEFTPRTTQPPPTESSKGFSNVPLVVLFSSLLVCLTAFTVFVLAYYYLSYKRREDKRKRRDQQLMEPNCTGSSVNHCSSANPVIDSGSGSGSGLPLLVQRTIAKQIQLVESIGKGRFGEVWLAKWRDEKVAVKIFFTSEEESWFRETEIYQTVLMRHENILGFIAADILGSSSWTKMLLITDYHELGSLSDYLQKRTINEQALKIFATSLSSGLAHLHTEIYGTKPAIAHCDLKSQNVLVKHNGECVVKLCGLAVKFSSELNEIQKPTSSRVGTIRYMSPERLDQSMDESSMESFKSADIYSLGLIFWEMCSRFLSSNSQTKIIAPYSSPYSDMVSPDPSLQEMFEVVCIKKHRPLIPYEWYSDENPTLSTLSKLITECWHFNAAARLTALRIKKTLTKQDFENNANFS